MSNFKQLFKRRTVKLKETNAAGYPIYPAADALYSRFRNNSSILPKTTRYIYNPSRLEILNDLSRDE